MIRAENKKFPQKMNLARSGTTEKLTRLDIDEELRKKILPYCRLKTGDIWEDPKGKHKVGVLDATSTDDTKKLFGKEKARLVINDPPYNVVVGSANTQNLSKINIAEYIIFSRKWITECYFYY